jgi:hypothetical protein
LVLTKHTEKVEITSNEMNLLGSLLKVFITQLGLACFLTQFFI